MARSSTGFLSHLRRSTWIWVGLRPLARRRCRRCAAVMMAPCLRLPSRIRSCEHLSAGHVPGRAEASSIMPVYRHSNCRPPSSRFHAWRISRPSSINRSNMAPPPEASSPPSTRTWRDTYRSTCTLPQSPLLDIAAAGQLSLRTSTWMDTAGDRASPRRQAHTRSLERHRERA